MATSVFHLIFDFPSVR